MMVGDAMELIHHFYVDDVDDQALLTAAMKGLTDSLDEHSSYIPGDAYDSFQDSINQEFAGIGIFVEQPNPDEPVRVITPLVGSPALLGGILPDDRIIEVDDIDVSKMVLGDVSDLLKGPIGTPVKVKVLRGDQDQHSITVRRANIELESVIGDYRDDNSKWVFRLQSHPSIAYIRLTSFGEKTVRELEGVLATLNNEFDAMVLDLRGNSGGLLYAARDVSDMFLDSGRIVSTRTRGNVIEDVYDATPGTLVDPSKPLAILIDGGSASASEIVAACLQDNHRATIVGTRSYGKGTVQNILPLQFGRSALRLTVARYYRPNDHNIHRKEDATEEDEWGVTPDDGFTVSVDDKTLEQLGDRWRQASYPLLSAATGTTDPAGAPQDAGTAKDAGNPQANVASDTPNKTETPVASGVNEPPIIVQEPQASVLFDPQLRVAVEHLTEQIDNDAPAAPPSGKNDDAAARPAPQHSDKPAA
ncbi:MAG: S41 family peptidase [Pirellulaceae bacterium]|nr:S41 family peptidase [Pirellulaceae bacterium]